MILRDPTMSAKIVPQGDIASTSHDARAYG
jgi:hypothetical protein